MPPGGSASDGKVKRFLPLASARDQRVISTVARPSLRTVTVSPFTSAAPSGGWATSTTMRTGPLPVIRGGVADRGVAVGFNALAVDETGGTVTGMSGTSALR